MAIWEKNKGEFFYEGYALIYHNGCGVFFGYSRLIKSGRTKGIKVLRSFPPNQATEQQNRFAQTKAPLLSRIITYFFQRPITLSIVNRGNKKISPYCLLTAIAIFFAFGRTGYWVEGGSRSFPGGGLSFAYYWRSTIGRIDTDQLKTFGLMGFYVCNGFVCRKSKKTKGGGLSSHFTALTARVFMLWYGKSELIIMALIALCWLPFSLLLGIKKGKIGFSMYLSFYQVGLINHLQKFINPNRFWF
ncbi:MAG: hypothetical protein CM15mP117_06950 [Alphaproteobacteria bacterium]|nr:MAG: hypothetical protein CM15mP117_06950 [Alphaproteobacteria bacterium]